MPLDCDANLNVTECYVLLMSEKSVLWELMSNRKDVSDKITWNLKYMVDLGEVYW